MEIKVDDFIVCLDGRVVEIFHTQSSWKDRIHVDLFAAEAKPDGDGAKVRLGMMLPGKHELFVGAGGTRMKLDAAEWALFQEFVGTVKALKSPQ
jgi:hypothetical protein